MSQKTVVMCSCSGSQSLLKGLDDAHLGDSVSVSVTEHACRNGLKGLGDLLGKIEAGSAALIGCSQEPQLMSRVAPAVHNVQFFDLRSVVMSHRKVHDTSATKAVAAGRAAFEAALEIDPVPGVAFRSEGRLLVITEQGADLGLLDQAASTLSIDVALANSLGVKLPQTRNLNVLSAKVAHLHGYLGQFSATLESTNPIDSELCTRCGACVDACPTGSISAQSIAVNLDSCDRSGACIKACGDFKAIDFSRVGERFVREYDLVIDCTGGSLFAGQQSPLGYWSCPSSGTDTGSLPMALLEALQTVGEFEKPRFFKYNSKVCAHERSHKTGCSSCIDTCSTRAIQGVGEGVSVDPHLCLGCGACASVCPTGAIEYGFEPVASIGKAIRAGLQVTRSLSDLPVNIVVSSRDKAPSGGVASSPPAAKADALALPVELHHAASVGPDLWLAAVAFGANQVLIELSDSESKFYGKAIKHQIEWVNELLVGLGLKARVSMLEPGVSVFSAIDVASIKPATWDMPAGKRARLEFAVDHLWEQSISLGLSSLSDGDVIALPKGAPFGTVAVDQSKCTLCLSCTSACPSSALIDNSEAPMLRFIERNCVQCGLCVSTCPEGALAITPQLLLGAKAREKRILNQSEPFRCIKCGTAFGTKHLIESMLSRLGSHSMFNGDTNRLKMCGDCRVSDMFSATNEMSIFEVKR